MIYLRDAQGNLVYVFEHTIEESLAHLKLKEQHIYGTSRLGMKNCDREMIGAQAVSDVGTFALVRGEKSYELSNHLGNVLEVITDQKFAISDGGSGIDHFLAEVISYTDYYPFGAPMDNGSASTDRNWQGDYRYGFNGKELEPLVNTGEYDFGARMYDGRLGSWWSTDQLMNSNAFISPYAGYENGPVFFRDLNGKDAIVTVVDHTITISSVIKIYGANATEDKAQEIQDGIMQYWGTPFTYTDENGEVYNVKFNVTVESMDFQDFISPINNFIEGNNIVELHYSSNDKDPFDKTPWYRSRVSPDGATGDWSDNDGSITYAHEYGHLLGLADMYFEARYPNRPKPETRNYESVSGPKEIMGKASGEGSDLSPEVSQSDINAIAIHALVLNKEGKSILSSKGMPFNKPTVKDVQSVLDKGAIFEDIK